jgi:hypothetical protein
MASSFPTSLDSFTDPQSSDKLNSPSHSTQHADLNDAVEKVEAKVGKDSSDVNTSHDYKLSSVDDGQKAVSTSGNQTIAGNKTWSGIQDYNAATKQLIKSNADGATITFDMDASNIHTITGGLGGNRTLAVSNVDVGQVFILRIPQDGTGSRTVTWFSTIKWPSGTAPTLSTDANAVDVFGFICTSEGNYDGFFVGFDLS